MQRLHGVPGAVQHEAAPNDSRRMYVCACVRTITHAVYGNVVLGA